MTNIAFTEDQIAQLKYERFHHPRPRVQRKMEALYLKAMEMPHQKICMLAGISPNTLRSYLRGPIPKRKRSLKKSCCPA